MPRICRGRFVLERAPPRRPPGRGVTPSIQYASHIHSGVSLLSSPPPSARTRAKRIYERASYDRETLYAVLDAGMLCHVGYIFDGYPVVTPTLYWREGDAIYWHGSSASRALRASQDLDVCLTVTHLDGLVLARSAFHHSANYRSAMIFGTARLLADPAEKLASLKAMMDSLCPGRCPPPIRRSRRPASSGCRSTKHR